MSIFLLTYDLNKEIKRPPIVQEVKKSPYWAQLSESSYSIDTAETVAQVRTRFARYIDSNDSFYVIKLSAPWGGQGPKEVNDWLAQRLGSASG